MIFIFCNDTCSPEQSAVVKRASGDPTTGLVAESLRFKCTIDEQRRDAALILRALPCRAL